MASAIEAVRKVMGLKRASKQYAMPTSTLKDWRRFEHFSKERPRDENGIQRRNGER